MSPAGDEFGEDRLNQLILTHRRRTAQGLLDSVIDALRAFATGEQQDDITVLVVRSNEER